jgi:hypothetical protein
VTLHWMTCRKTTSEVLAVTKYARQVRQTLPIVVLGTVAWFVVLVIQLAISAKTSSILISLVGIALGFLGTIYILRGMWRKRQKMKTK